MSRRRFLVGLGAAGAGLALAGCSGGSARSGAPPTTAAAATTAAAGTPTTVGADACALTAELTPGPYYLSDQRVRRDITEGRPGVPLDLRITVVDSRTCKPSPGAAVDIWHCDAGGEYSGFFGSSLAETNARGRNDKRFLRGVQLTGDDGRASFRTIYPGWYEGRAIHVHCKVHVGGDAGTTYRGGHVAHVGQFFFDESTTTAVLKLPPYVSHVGDRTMNAQDPIYREAGISSILRITSTDPADLSRGLTGVITVSIDPTSTPQPAPAF